MFFLWLLGKLDRQLHRAVLMVQPVLRWKVGCSPKYPMGMKSFGLYHKDVQDKDDGDFESRGKQLSRV